MAINAKRDKILFLPVIRGNYDTELTRRVKAAVRRAADDLGLDGIFPADDRYSHGTIRSDDDVRNYFEAWRTNLADIKALIVVSGDFMRERAVMDTVRLLPPDVPVFMIVNNDIPADMGAQSMGDSLCGTLSVHCDTRMLNRRILRSCRIDMHDPECLKGFLAQYARLADGIECLRNMRIATIGVNPAEFVTTFTNQIKLFELGFSLHPYELITLWGDTMLAPLAAAGANHVSGDFGSVTLWRPIRSADPRIAETVARMRTLGGHLPAEEAKLAAIARCYLWVRDTFEADRIDTGAIHCWSEFGRFFGVAPCAFAMLANAWLRKPLVCEVDVGHAIMARLAWELTGEAGVILDVNNNGWDPRVFNVFHCSQTPGNWLQAPPDINNGGTVEGVLAPVPFTAVSAATTADAFCATIFQGRMLREAPGRRGSSGWAFVPNLPEALKAVEQKGIHHFVAFKGHLGPELADVLRFRGLDVHDLSVDVPAAADIEACLPPLDRAARAPCRVFSA